MQYSTLAATASTDMQAQVHPLAIAPAIAPAYGALAHLASDNLYFGGHGGCLYTCPYIHTPCCAPHSAAIFLSACGNNFSVRFPGSDIARVERAAALSCAPRSLSAIGVKMIIVHVSPLHPAYRALQGIARPGLLSLDRERFAALDVQLDLAFRGALSPFEASHLYDRILDLAYGALPRPKPADMRAQQWIATLRLDPHLSLRKLANESGLSYQHMSRIFGEALGLPLRQFQLWKKLDRVRRVYGDHDNLTDVAHAAGFSDLAHMTRVFQRNYGAPPSYFFRNPNVRIFGARPDTRDSSVTHHKPSAAPALDRAFRLGSGTTVAC